MTRPSIGPGDGVPHPAVAGGPVQREHLPSVAAVLLAVGREAADLERSALVLQNDLAPLLHPSRAGNAAVFEFQVLDLLSQRLRGLADFLRVLAPSLPGDWRCDAGMAAASVTLSDLRNRLGAPAEGAPPALASEAGVLHLF